MVIKLKSQLKNGNNSIFYIDIVVKFVYNKWNREINILIELKEINQKLDELNDSPQGLSNPVKFIALFIGFTVIGSIFAILLPKLFE
jgi:hypothetical protein